MIIKPPPKRNDLDSLIAVMYYSTYSEIAEKLRISNEYLYQIKRGTKKISDKVLKSIRSIQLDLNTTLPKGAHPITEALRIQSKTSWSLQELESLGTIMNGILEGNKNDILRYQIYFLKTINHFRIAQVLEKNDSRRKTEIQLAMNYCVKISDSLLEETWKVLAEINLIGFAFYLNEIISNGCVDQQRYRWFYKQYCSIKAKVKNPYHKELVMCNSLRMASLSEDIDLCRRSYHLLWQQMEKNQRPHINHCMNKIINHDHSMIFFYDNRSLILNESPPKANNIINL